MNKTLEYIIDRLDSQLNKYKDSVSYEIHYDDYDRSFYVKFSGTKITGYKSFNIFASDLIDELFSQNQTFYLYILDPMSSLKEVGTMVYYGEINNIEYISDIFNPAVHSVHERAMSLIDEYILAAPSNSPTFSYGSIATTEVNEHKLAA